MFVKRSALQTAAYVLSAVISIITKLFMPVPVLSLPRPKGLFLFPVQIYWSWEEGSQNHRMAAFGRDLYGSSSPAPLTKKGHLQQAAQDLVQVGLNISREGDSTTSLGKVFQCSVTLRGKKFFLMFSWNFPCFSLCPLPLVLSLGTTDKSLAPSS